MTTLKLGDTRRRPVIRRMFPSAHAPLTGSVSDYSCHMTGRIYQSRDAGIYPAARVE